MTMTCAPLDASENPNSKERLLTDFTTTSADLGWHVVNDSVMGGRSHGRFSVDDGTLQFTGHTNTNGGGFSSIRTASLQLDLSAFSGVRLAVKGDGRRYTWRLTTNATWRGRQVSFWADFDTRDGEWQVADLPFNAFIPRMRGYQLEGIELDPDTITGMGLMIYDGEDSDFDLQLASVHAYANHESFDVTRYRWQQRMLVVSAPRHDDEHLAAQLHAVAASPQDFAGRDLVLVTLVDDGNSAAGNQALNDADVASARAALDMTPGAFALRLVGKDGSVKLARDSATAMADIYALIDTMPMRRAEIARID